MVESTDHKELARWWAEALGWDVRFELAPESVFVPVRHRKSGRNRLHRDFAPRTSDERDAEIARLVELGATVVDVVQPDEATWTVLEDPDGNEFCVLSARGE